MPRCSLARGGHRNTEQYLYIRPVLLCVPSERYILGSHPEPAHIFVLCGGNLAGSAAPTFS